MNVDQKELSEKMEYITDNYIASIKKCKNEEDLENKFEKIRLDLADSIRQILSYEELILLVSVHVAEQSIKQTFQKSLGFLVSDRDE